MSGKLVMSLLAAALVTGMSASAPLAQQHEGGRGGHGMMGSMMKGGVLSSEERRKAKIEGRIAFLKTALEIKDSQLDDWNTYADGLRAQKHKGHGKSRGSHGMMGGGRMGGGKDDKTAMQQMDDRIARMETHIADLKALKPLADALYKVLDDDQKKKANALLMKKDR